MLQQTRVETAAPYYRRWMDRFPSVAELAEADEEDVLKAWEGLGYYSRARNLHRSARIVRDELNGVLPTDAASLRALPGIGEYSAGAIASIAYGEATPAVDGNVRRVISRLFDLPNPKPAVLRAKATEVLDVRRPGDWNQAVMELGATLCLPRNPRCGECPVVEHCLSHRNGTQELRPGTKRRAAVREATFAVLVAARGSGEFLMVRRPPHGMLAGLWEFPAVEVDDQNGLQEACSRVAKGLGIVLSTGVEWGPLRPVKHAFSHLKALYRPLLTTLVGPDPIGSEEHPADPDHAALDPTEGAVGPTEGSVDPDEGLSTNGPAAVGDSPRWVGPIEVEALPLPVAQRKILALARAECQALMPPNGSKPL